MRFLSILGLLLTSLAQAANHQHTNSESWLVFSWSEIGLRQAQPSLVAGSVIATSAIRHACLKRQRSADDLLVYYPDHGVCYRLADLPPREQFSVQREVGFDRGSAKSAGGVWHWRMPIRSKGVCGCPTSPLPSAVIEQNASQIALTLDPIDPIVFAGSESGGPAPSTELSWRVDGGSSTPGVPMGLASSCQTVSNRVTCTVSGNAPESPGAYQIAFRATNSQGSSSATASLQVDPAPSSISGTLSRDSDGSAVTPALMLLYETAQGSAEAASAITDENGAFTFNDLSPGTYTVGTFGLAEFGLLNEFYLDVDCALGCDPSIGTPITLAIGEDRTGIDISAASAGSIRGRVTRSDNGLPIVDAVVNSQFVNTNGTLSNSNIGFTDQNGLYEIGGLPAGDYKVALGQLHDAQVINADGLLAEVYDNIPCPCLFSAGDSVSVVLGAATENIDFELELAPFQVGGRVVNSIDGSPIEGAEVQIVEQDISAFDEPAVNQAGKEITDADGRYQFAVPAGNYVVSTNAAPLGFVDEWFDDLTQSGTRFEDVPPLAINDNRSDIDFELLPGSRIEGRVTRADDGSPVFPLLVVGQNQTDGMDFAVETTADGSYSMRGITAGQYRVSIFSGSGFNLIKEVYDNIQCLPCEGVTGDLVSVVFGSATTGIDFVLETGAGIAGQVEKAENSEVLPGVLVFFFDRQGTDVGQAFVDVTGRYTFQGLIPGSYTVLTTRAGNFSTINEIWDDKPCIGDCDPRSGSQISLVAGQLRQDIDFALASVPVLADDTPVDLDALGQSIVADRDRLFVGIPGDDTMGQDAGAVAVFRLSGGVFELETTLFADAAIPGERFGTTLAVNGGTLVVAAPLVGSGNKGAIEPGIYTITFDGNGFVQQQRLTATNLVSIINSGFAASVAIDRDLIAVGAPDGQKASTDSAGDGSLVAGGAVVVFERAQGVFTQSYVLVNPTGNAGDAFGASVTIDGDRIIVGSPNANASGQVFVFDVPAAKGLFNPIVLQGTGTSGGDRFGASVASSGGVLVVGAPTHDGAANDAGAAFVFNSESGAYLETRRILPVDPALDTSHPDFLLGAENGAFGEAVGIRDGAMVIGATGESANTGAAYVFTADDDSAGNWTLGDRLERGDGLSGDALGAAVAVENGVVAIGAPNAEREGVTGGLVLGAGTDQNPLFGD